LIFRKPVDSPDLFYPQPATYRPGSLEVNGHFPYEYYSARRLRRALPAEMMMTSATASFRPLFVYRKTPIAWRAQLSAGSALCAYAEAITAERAAGQSPGFTRRNQHALGEEPVPAADQEHYMGPLPAQFLLHHGARHSGPELFLCGSIRLKDSFLSGTGRRCRKSAADYVRTSG